MRRMGRMTKLTPALQDAIVRAVSCGVPLVTAAQYVGVSQSTVFQWMQRGEGRTVRPAHTVYVEFVEHIQKAKAEDETRRIVRLEKAARGGEVLCEKTITYPDGRVQREVKYSEPQWTADAWFLERSRPETWGRRDLVDMRLTISAAVARVAQELGLTPEAVLAEAQALLKEVDDGHP